LRTEATELLLLLLLLLIYGQLIRHSKVTAMGTGKGKLPLCLTGQAPTRENVLRSGDIGLLFFTLALVGSESSVSRAGLF
jgi:hypothetical protein